MNGDQAVSALTDEQIAAYHEQGFLIVPKVCSPDLINMYNRHIYAIRAADPIPKWADSNVATGDVTDAGRFQVRLFNPHLYDGFTLQMFKHPFIAEALRQLYGRPAAGVQSMYFYKAAGSKGQAPHQDFPYIRNEPNTLMAASIALDVHDAENGCLRVIPGSHLQGVYEHGQVDDLNEHEHFTVESKGVDTSKEVLVEMNQGDVVFFHGLLVHWSNRNVSADRWRRALTSHYIREDSELIRLGKTPPGVEFSDKVKLEG